MGKNCWEFMDCGREPGGINSKKLGICPAASSNKFDGINNGKNAGRYCWHVAGTLCKGKIQGTFAEKYGDCLACPFYFRIHKDEITNQNDLCKIEEI